VLEGQLSLFDFAAEEEKQQYQITMPKVPEISRDHLCDRVTAGVRKVQNTSHIPHNTLGRQGTEGNDLYHLILSVFLDHVIDDFLPAFEAEVNIDIRHGYPFRVQETLKEQIIAHRIDISDLQTVGNDTSRCGTSSRILRNE
jgi:hypothetical protein